MKLKLEEKIMGTNPAIKKLEEYQRLENDSNSCMTINGTIISLFILGLVLLLPATISWSWFAQGYMDKIQICIYNFHIMNCT